MGIIDKAIGKVLEAVPLNKAIGEIPILKTLKWTYKAGKAGYKIGTYIDQKTDLSGKTAKGAINTFGPASKGLIDKADKLSGMVNKGMGMYQDVVNKAKSMVGMNQSGVLSQNPSGSKKQASFIPSATTKIAASASTIQKIASLKTGTGKQIKSIKSAGAHPAKAVKAAGSSPLKTAFNPATNKMFSIKQQAAKFPMTSKAFTIKNQASPVKKFSPTKVKTFVPAKSSGMPKTNMAKSPAKSAFSMKPLNRPIPIHRSPSISRPVMRSVPLRK